MKVKLIMSTPIILKPQAPLYKAAQMMADEGIGSVIITDEKNNAIGIVTDRDIVTRGIAYGYSVHEPVKTIMSKRLHTINENESVSMALFLMAMHQVRRLVVVDDYSKLAGVVSLGDIAKTERFDLAVGQTLTRISFPYSDWMNHPHFGVEVDDFRL